MDGSHTEGPGDRYSPRVCFHPRYTNHPSRRTTSRLGPISKIITTASIHIRVAVLPAVGHAPIRRYHR